jgi:trehalose monomycolate/heme transporter
MDPALFPGQRLMPIDALVEVEGDVLAPDNVGALFDFARGVERLPGIEHVDSLVTSGERRDRDTYRMLGSVVDRLPADVQAKIAKVARGSYARLVIASAHPPSSAQARHQLDEIRALAPAGMTVQFAGRTQMAAELEHDLADRAPEAVLSIAAVTFAVLFIAFGSVVLPFKALLMNALSVAASYGVLVWIFQDGRFEHVLAYESSGAIDPTILAVTFAVMFGLSMDYEVFLLSRIREEYARGRENADAVALGLGASGRVITGAAAILLAVVVGFVAGQMIFIKELGVGMAVAVIVDATLVRTLLLPAAMAMLGRWNWWSPASWRKWWEKSGLGIHEPTVLLQR